MMLSISFIPKHSCFKVLITVYFNRSVYFIINVYLQVVWRKKLQDIKNRNNKLLYKDKRVANLPV